MDFLRLGDCVTEARFKRLKRLIQIANYIQFLSLALFALIFLLLRPPSVDPVFFLLLILLFIFSSLVPVLLLRGNPTERQLIVGVLWSFLSFIFGFVAVVGIIHGSLFDEIVILSALVAILLLPTFYRVPGLTDMSLRKLRKGMPGEYGIFGGVSAKMEVVSKNKARARFVAIMTGMFLLLIVGGTSRAISGNGPFNWALLLWVTGPSAAALIALTTLASFLTWKSFSNIRLDTFDGKNLWYYGELGELRSLWIPPRRAKVVDDRILFVRRPLYSLRIELPTKPDSVSLTSVLARQL